MLFEQRVVDVVARVPLVACKIDGTIDVDRQVRIDLDETAVVALVPVVAAPRLFRDEFHREALAGRQLGMRKRPLPTLGDGGVEDPTELVRRNDEVFPERVVAVDEGTPAWQKLLKLGQRDLERELGTNRRHGIVQGLRLFVEGEGGAREHAYPGPQRFELPPEIHVTQDGQVVGVRAGRRRARAVDEPCGFRVESRRGTASAVPPRISTPAGRSRHRRRRHRAGLAPGRA